MDSFATNNFVFTAVLLIGGLEVVASVTESLLTEISSIMLPSPITLGVYL